MNRENQPMKIGELTRREYKWLKSFPENALTDQEKDKIAQYEEKWNSPIIEHKKKFETIKPKKRPEKITITRKLIWTKFLTVFKSHIGHEFKQTEESLKNIAPIIEYFARDEKFFTRSNVIKQIGYRELKPSFEKGLLMIGAYGNGKTDIMKTLSYMFNHYQMPMRFKFANSHQMVSEWETASTPGDKDLYLERYLCRAICIDDIKKEREASNYGKVEIVRDIIEKRHSARNRITHLNCNYREGDTQNSIEDALDEIGERYGGHIYDRLIGSCNIIEFGGKSFRN